jgi:hypothetical protein
MITITTSSHTKSSKIQCLISATSIQLSSFLFERKSSVAGEKQNKCSLSLLQNTNRSTNADKPMVWFALVHLCDSSIESGGKIFLLWNLML